MNLKNPEVIDSRTFPAIYGEWNGRVRSFARKYGRHADDIAASAWCKVWESRDAFRAGSCFRAWVMTLAANAARDTLRREKRRSASSIDAPTATGDTVGSLIADSSAVDPATDSRIRDIRAALAALPAAQADIIRLAMAGRDYAAIAEILAIPLGTVKSRLNAARAALAARLAE